MAKPRIVIMDDDLSYIIPLQSKFIYEFLDDIDLEIITDPHYYEEMFVSLQKIDILITDKKYCLDDFNKHEIDYIFVMTEDPNDDMESAENVHVLYKYSNVKRIFLEIVGKSGLKVPVQNKKKDSEIILVTSASGGRGKTTIALGIATALSDMYKKVLYIEAARLQTFQYFLQNTDPIYRQDVYARLVHPNQYIYQEIKPELRVEGFTYMPPLKSSLMAYGIDFSTFGKVAKSAKLSGEFDYIIIDADTTFDDSKAKMMSVADRVMVVTEQTRQAAYATEILVENINDIEAGKYLFVCNKYANKGENIFAPKTSFDIDEYVAEFENYNEMTYRDFAKEETIQKVAFLLI